jgi:hypothetical protein
MSKPALVMSLTTIPPRFPYLIESLECLLNQTAPIESINLYIPRRYRRFTYSPNDIPALPNGVTLHIVDEDLGPATKVLPACKQYKGQDIMILFGDDDRIYDKDWAQRFLDAAQQRPGHVICEEGGPLYMPYYAGTNDSWISVKQPRTNHIKKDNYYRLARIGTLGLWKPSTTISSGYVDILEGWGGVLVKPDYFDEEDFEIPDILWTVDDAWLSGCLERKNIPIWLSTEGKVRSKENSNEVLEAALKSLIYKGYDRTAANRLCIKHFRDHDHIWGGNPGGKS